MEMHLKMTSAKCWLFRLDPNVLMYDEKKLATLNELIMGPVTP